MSSQSCIFCKIVRGDIPAKEVERSDTVVAFRDLNPQAPDHVLVIPVRHAENLTEFAGSASAAEVAALVGAAARIGKQLGGADGYRVVTNEGPSGGQTVGHLHFHVLAGRRMTWPPG